MGWFRRLRGWLVAVGVSVAAAAGVFALGNRGQPPSKGEIDGAAKVTDEPKPVMVTVDPVSVRPIQRRVQVVGSLWGMDEVAITPKVDGPIVKIHKYVGDTVRAGDMLMEIDEKNYRLALDEARHALNVELAKLGLDMELPNDFAKASLPSVVKAAVQERLASQQRDRIRRLSASTIEERERADADLAAAQATHRQMLLEAETAIAQARYKQALLATAQQKLNDTKVIVQAENLPSGSPPTEYLVAERNVSAGETVNTAIATKPVYRLVIADPLKLIATVPERFVDEVKVDQNVEITVESHPDRTFLGKVARVNPTVDRTSRTFQVEILIRNPQRALHAGSFAKGAILTRIDDRALTLPEEALVAFAGVTKIFVLRGSKVEEVSVETGVRMPVNGANRSRVWVEIKGKLRPEEQVVTSGQSKLTDGTLAKVRPTSIRERENESR